MPFYHGTTTDRLPSIYQHGLGWSGAKKNWDCDSGVYLAEDDALAVAVLIQHFLENASEDTVPSEALAQMCVIVIDDSRVNRALLRPDPEFNHGQVWIHEGIIDATNMPVIGVADLTADWNRRGLIDA